MLNVPEKSAEYPTVSTNVTTRRRFFKTSAIHASPVLQGACTSVSEMKEKVTGADTGYVDTYHRMIGDIVVTTLLDGYFPFEQEMLRNVDKNELK